MLSEFYTISSPHFPSPADFAKWPLWCEWHDASELDKLRNAGLSEADVELQFLNPNASGSEVYYPIQTSSLSTVREFTYALSNFEIGDHEDVTGYLSLIQSEVVAATIWISSAEICLLRNDRLAADDENPPAIAMVCDEFSVDSITTLGYNSTVADSKGDRLCGELLLR